MRYLLVLVLLLVGGGTPATAQVAGGAPDQGATIEQFHAEIAKYMAFRRQVQTEVRGPVPESTAQALNDAGDALAAAIRRARPNAKQGALFLPAVSVELKRRVEAAVRTANLGPVLAGIDDDGASIKKPDIHLRFPTTTQMASMPPSLLAVLPTLPKELEYRIVGNYLVLRDVDAALVLDYIPAAIPR